MANTYVDYTATAAQQYFAFNFPYLEDEHIIVEIEGVDQTITTNYTIETSPTQRINLSNPTTALAGGELVRIKRRSAPNTNLVDFQNGSVLTESELDRAYLHNRYLAEEATEGADSGLKELEGSTNFNANNKQIKNLADGTLATDAVNKGYIDTQIALTDTNLAGFYKSTHTGNGIDNVFTLSFTPQTTDAKAYIVSIDGLVQVPDTDYTIGATAITFNTIPANSAEICVVATAAASVATVNEIQVRATGTTTARSLADRFGDVVNVLDFIPSSEHANIKNGTTTYDAIDDIEAAITAASATVNTGDDAKTLFFPNGTYIVSTELNMPHLVEGDFNITGDVKWSFKKHIVQKGRMTISGSVTFDSIWYSDFAYINTGIGTFKLESTNSQWGVFWNKFDTVRCGLFLIDVDGGQSVNQNTFQNIKCNQGLHVRGTNTTGLRECHNNLFQNIDTTSADLTATDGSTGHHILNDSVLNQPNTVINWYAELSGSRSIFGNWHVLSSNIDATGIPIKVKRENHFLYAGGKGRNGDYFAGSPINKSRGGNFKQFNKEQLPLGVSTTAIATSSISTNAPDGNPLSIAFTTASTFRSIRFSYPLGSSSQLGFSAFIKRFNNPAMDIQVRTASESEPVVYPGTSLIDVGNGWELLRFSIDADYLGGSGNTDGLITLFLTDDTVPIPNPIIHLGSFFIATEQTVFLPQYEQGVKEIYDTTFPTNVSTIWSAGDICWNTTPTAGGTPGWICVTAGSPGTWKAMASLAV